MEKNKIFGFVNMGAALLLIISVFLPYVSVFSISKSLWSAEDPSRILLILLGIFVIALYLFNKKTEMSYITAGFGTFYAVAMVISAEGLDYFSIGFYTLILSSLTIGVMTFLYDESKVTPIINLSGNAKNKISNPQMNYQQPINPQQVVNNVQQVSPQQAVNSQPVEQPKIVGYDPNTGAPIYSNQN